jgi:hypothetical protein
MSLEYKYGYPRPDKYRMNGEEEQMVGKGERRWLRRE